MGRLPAGATAAPWLPTLADRLGTLVDVIGYDQWSFTPSTTYVDGFVTGLRAVWQAAGTGTSIDSPSRTQRPLAGDASRFADSAQDNTSLQSPSPASRAITTPGTASLGQEVGEKPDRPIFTTVKGILGSLNFDGETVTIRKEGHGPRMKGVTPLHIRDIEHVLVKPATALFHGYIQFVTRDRPPAPDMPHGLASGRPHREDPFSMSYPRRANDQVDILKRKIEQEMIRARRQKEAS